jgi:hypothetical protein
MRWWPRTETGLRRIAARAAARSDYESEHPIEKQFGVGNAAMLMRHGLPKQRAASIVPSRGNRIPPRRNWRMKSDA